VPDAVTLAAKGLQAERCLCLMFVGGRRPGRFSPKCRVGAYKGSTAKRRQGAERGGQGEGTKNENLEWGAEDPLKRVLMSGPHQAFEHATGIWGEREEEAGKGKVSCAATRPHRGKAIKDLRGAGDDPQMELIRDRRFGRGDGGQVCLPTRKKMVRKGDPS